MLSLKDIFHRAHLSGEPSHAVVRNIGAVQQNARDLIDEVFSQTLVQQRVPNLSKQAIAGAYLTQRALHHAEYAQNLAQHTSKKAQLRARQLSEEVQSCMIAAMNIYPQIVEELLGEKQPFPPSHPHVVARVLGRRLADIQAEQGISENLFQQIGQEIPFIVGRFSRRQRRAFRSAS